MRCIKTVGLFVVIFSAGLFAQPVPETVPQSKPAPVSEVTKTVSTKEQKGLAFEEGIKLIEEAIAYYVTEVAFEQSKTPVDSVEVNRLNSEKARYEQMLVGWKAHSPNNALRISSSVATPVTPSLAVESIDGTQKTAGELLTIMREMTQFKQSELSPPATLSTSISNRDEMIRREMERLDADDALKKRRKEEDAKLSLNARKARDTVDKAIKAELDAKRRAGLVCRSQADYDNVLINPDAVQRPYIFVHSLMHITSRESKIPAVIRQLDGGDGRIVVKNLAPGCSLSLVQRIGYANQDLIRYSAIGYGKLEGQTGTSLSPTIQLQECQGSTCKGTYSADWDIRLQ